MVGRACRIQKDQAGGVDGDGNDINASGLLSGIAAKIAISMPMK